MIEVKIEKWVNDGYSIGYFENKTVFIKGGIPDEIVLCKINRENKNIIYAEIIEVVKSNSSRISSDCKIYLDCGGCCFRHVEYSEELEIKKGLLEKELKFHLKEVIIPEIKITSDNFIGYRNNAQVKIQNSKIGFYREGTNDLIELPADGCKNLPTEMNTFLKKQKSNEKEIKLRLLDEKINNYLYQDSEINLIGKKILIPKNGFFQINRYLLLPWLEEILNSISNFNSILELFSGCGFLSVFLADKNSKIYSYELDFNSIEYAKKNAKQNNLKNIDFIQKNLFKDRVSKNHLASEVYLLNPPRAGLGKLILEEIRIYKPRKIFYSSCNYITLIQDLKSIYKDYQISKIHLFDFFPRTAYFETLIELERILP